MKTFIALCLILSIVVATLAQQEACQTGETKKEACNTCKCTNGLWACSKKFCIPQSSENRQRREIGSYCKPGETFQKGCNTCVCNKEGTNAACTLKACI